jgi:hypothetical protein
MQINKVISLFLLLFVNAISSSESRLLSQIFYKANEYQQFCEQNIVFPSAHALERIKRSSSLYTSIDNEFFERRVSQIIKIGDLINELPPSLYDLLERDPIGRIQGYFFALLEPRMYQEFIRLKVLDKYRLALEYAPLHAKFVIEKRSQHLNFE